MADTTDSQASTYAGGSVELERYAKPTPGGGTSIDWEGAAKGAAGTGAAAVCTAYGAAAAAPVCAMVGSAVAGALIKGAKGLGAEGTTAEELARMAAEDQLIFAADTQHALLTPALWKVLRTLRLYAQDAGSNPSYAGLAVMLAQWMSQRLPNRHTIWRVMSEHLERVGTCPPHPKNGPRPTKAQCTAPPISEWARYDGRPVLSSSGSERIYEPWPSAAWEGFGVSRGTGRFVRCVEGSCSIPNNALMSPMPPFVAPGADVFGTGTKALQGFRSMETWMRVLAESAVKVAGTFDKPKFFAGQVMTFKPKQPDLMATAGKTTAPGDASSEKPGAGKVAAYSVGGAVFGGAMGHLLSGKRNQRRNAVAGAIAAAVAAGVVASRG